MQCPACAAENPAEYLFCDTCGVALAVHCAQCGANGRPGARFCGQCGAPLAPPRPAPHPAEAPRAGYTPRHLADAVLTQAAIEGERRRVTVLFADMASFTALTEQHDPEDVHRIMNHCFALITDVVHRLEGTISQYTGDGVMALFGAPTALEDGPRRAVQAALDIQHALRDYSRALDAERGVQVRMRIGLHTGVVVVGRIGDDLRMDYTAMGDTTTLAARLQQVAAPGSVLISAATRNAVADHFETEDLGELQVKGHQAPIHAFEVLRSRPRRSRLQAAAERGLTPFTGRDRELEALVDLFAAAENGRGQVVFVAGDAGIGKSRLVYELRRHLALAGEEVTWLEGRCVSFGQTIPLLPVIGQVRELCEIDETDGADDIVAKVDIAIDRLGDLHMHAPYLRYLLCLDPGDAAVPHMDAALRRARTFQAVRALALGAVRRRPLVLVFEDLQWIDSSSQEYLTSLVDAVASAPILLICTYRLGYAPPFGSRSYFATLSLRGLSEADSLALAGQVLGAGALPRDVATALMQKAEGVPLFLEEVAKTLLDLGVLKPHDGGYRMVKPIAEVDIPDTIEGIIMARLDRLGESGKRTVQLASVIGRNFPKRLLERIAEVPAHLEGVLAELKRLEIIYEHGLPPDPAYVFKHAVIRDVAYNSLLLQRRKELHRAIGRAIEELYGERLAEHYGELAHHFAGGEQWATALEFARRAGDQAAHAYANVEANGHYAVALRAAEQVQPPPEPGALAALHIKRGAVLNTLGEYDASIAHYERALAMVRDAGDRRAELNVVLGLADVHCNSHHSGEALSYCEQALEIADALHDPAAQATCHASRSVYVSAWQGPVAEARRSAKLALELTEQVESPRLRARTLIFLGSVLQWRADLEGCLPYLHEGAVLAEQTHSGNILGHALFHLGHANLARGLYQQALHWYGDMSRYADGANDKFWIARAPNLVGGVHLELYDVDTAIRLCLEGDEIAQQLFPWPEPRGHCLVKLGLAHLQRGEHGAADDALRHAWSLLELDAWARWRWLMPLLRARAELLLATDKLDEAWNYALQSLELATQTDSRKHLALSKVLLGEIAAAQDRLPEAEKLLRNAVGLAEHIGAARPLWLAASALGQTLVHVGRDREGEAYLIQAAQTVETIAHDLTDPALRASFVRADPVAEVYRQLGRRPVPIAG
jgi:class 3 adenylate cyclase/tetratricopeptide (TPR) repeat protein